MSQNLSRMERYGRKKKDKDQKNKPDAADETNEMRSRRELHPSNKGRMSRIFYNTLIILFILLTVSLLVWGQRLLK